MSSGWNKEEVEGLLPANQFDWTCVDVDNQRSTEEEVDVTH